MAVDTKCSKEGESLCSAEYKKDRDDIGEDCKAIKITTVIYLFWVYSFIPLFAWISVISAMPTYDFLELLLSL